MASRFTTTKNYAALIKLKGYLNRFDKLIASTTKRDGGVVIEIVMEVCIPATIAMKTTQTSTSN